MKFSAVWLCLLLAFQTRAATATIDIFNNFFSPPDVTVTVGDTVTWVQRGFNHNTESTQGIWQSAILQPGETFSFTFNQPGSYPYLCRPHRTFMRGTVTVQAPQNNPPVINLTAPADGSQFASGQSITFSANASDPDPGGSVALVEFFANGSSVGSINTAPFTITANNLPAGTYTVNARATDNAGAAGTSGSVTITITNTPPGNPPVITRQPQNQTTPPGGDASFIVEASGTPPIFYQWIHDGNAIPNATNNSLTLQNVSSQDAGLYSAVVRNLQGSVISQNAVLTLGTITSSAPTREVVQPSSNQMFRAGTPVTFSVRAGDPDGIARLDLLLDGALISSTPASDSSIILQSIPLGPHQLTATATDRLNNSASISLPIKIVSAPLVTLRAPRNNTRSPLSSSITVIAATSGIGINRVRFFANDLPIGDSAGPIFSLNWIPPATGRYSLTAQAEDANGPGPLSPAISIIVSSPDKVPPTIQITRAPAEFSQPNGTVMLTGRATDNVGVDVIEFQLNGGSFRPLITAPVGPPATSLDWSHLFNLSAGTNVIRVRSVDFAGNRSEAAGRTYFYGVRSPLTLSVTGAGRISPNLNGENLVIGRYYQIRALPAPQNIFAGWEGLPGAETNRPFLNFQMHSNLALVAHFIPNPFAGLKGTYLGLFFESGDVDKNRIGAIRGTIGGLGMFTGQLTLGDQVFPIRAQFDFTMQTVIPLLRRPAKPVALTLRLNQDRAEITGELTDGDWTVPVRAERAVRAEAPLRVPLVVQNSSGMTVTDGDIVLSPQGNATVRFERGEIVPRIVVRATHLTATGEVPIYLSLDANHRLVGWLNVSPNSVSGTLLRVGNGETESFSVITPGF